jgi:hypothetical protein
MTKGASLGPLRRKGVSILQPGRRLWSLPEPGRASTLKLQRKSKATPKKKFFFDLPLISAT